VPKSLRCDALDDHVRASRRPLLADPLRPIPLISAASRLIVNTRFTTRSTPHLILSVTEDFRTPRPGCHAPMTHPATAVDEYLHSRDDHSPALFIGFQPSKQGHQLQPPHRRRSATHMPPTRPATRDPAVSPPAAPAHLGTLLQKTMGDARLTAKTLGHRGLGSVSGYTKITDQRRRQSRGIRGNAAPGALASPRSPQRIRGPS
jgi:hypothetical protein